MTEHQMARRGLTSQIDYNRAAVTREATHVSEAAKRIAEDVDTAIATGKVSSLAQEVQQLLIRATQLGSQVEALEIFDAAFPGKDGRQ